MYSTERSRNYVRILLCFYVRTAVAFGDDAGDEQQRVSEHCQLGHCQLRDVQHHDQRAMMNDAEP